MVIILKNRYTITVRVSEFSCLKSPEEKFNTEWKRINEFTIYFYFYFLICVLWYSMKKFYFIIPWFGCSKFTTKFATLYKVYYIWYINVMPARPLVDIPIWNFAHGVFFLFICIKHRYGPLCHIVDTQTDRTKSSLCMNNFFFVKISL